MPDAMRAETFVTRALRHGIAVSPGSAFAIGGGHSPAGVRLAFGAPPLPVLTEALRTLRKLIDNPADDLVD
jgi:DNA-binding transcriptional MocR family regulator